MSYIICNDPQEPRVAARIEKHKGWRDHKCLEGHEGQEDNEIMT